MLFFQVVKYRPILPVSLSTIDHYSDVILGAMASEITGLTIVYSTVYSDAGQRKHQSSASLAFVRGIHRWPVNSLHINGQQRRKCFNLMSSSWILDITRYSTQYINFEAKTSATLRPHERQAYLELWVSFVSYVEKSDRKISGMHSITSPVQVQPYKWISSNEATRKYMGKLVTYVH